MRTYPAVELSRFRRVRHALAHLLVDLNLADIDHHIRELRETAQRCIDCQRFEEHTRLGTAPAM